MQKLLYFLIYLAWTIVSCLQFLLVEMDSSFSMLLLLAAIYLTLTAVTLLVWRESLSNPHKGRRL